MRDRLPVLALRTIPGAGKARYVCGADRIFPGNKGGVGKCSFRGTCDRSGRNLVGGADWVAVGGYCGFWLLLYAEKEAALFRRKGLLALPSNTEGRS